MLQKDAGQLFFFKAQSAFLEEIRSQNEKKDRRPKALVETFGCQQNENDSEKLRGMLALMGYEMAESRENANVIIFNTCAVRGNAEKKVLGHLGAIKPLKDGKKDLLIGVCGCMMQQEHMVSTIRRSYPQVDFVFGTHTLHKLPEILLNATDKRKRIFDVLDVPGNVIEEVPLIRDQKYKAWLSIMYGCNNFCSYCIVPYARGRERSRQGDAILEEAKRLLDDGVKEITLLGQNVNSYGKDFGLENAFPELLLKICELPFDFRLRFMTSHPKDASSELFDAMGHEKMAKHLHLPFQAGSNRILKEMNRGYTRESYLEKVKLLRMKNPGISLTSDVIVGFPGETEEDFLDTLDVIRKAQFDNIYSFLYSKREGTPAAGMENQVPEEEKHRRFDAMQKIQQDISLRINESYVGKIEKVLVEGPSKTDDTFLTGRLSENKLVHFKGNCETGEFCEVKIEEAKTWTLFGSIL